jgi:hypothetical protein
MMVMEMMVEMVMEMMVMVVLMMVMMVTAHKTHIFGGSIVPVDHQEVALSKSVRLHKLPCQQASTDIIRPWIMNR